MIETIKKLSAEIEKKVIDIRRDFHKYPEVAFTEFRTASLIAAELKKIGCEIKIGKEVVDEKTRHALPDKRVLQETYERALAQDGDKEFLEKVKGGFSGVVGIISNGKGPVVALRVDIDALPVEESSDKNHFPLKEGFASVNKGIMHACGHDANAATGLGVAMLLMKLKDKIKGTVKIIFQPAEESITGAYSMINSGILDDVDRIFSIHYFSPWPSGTMTCIRGSGYLATTKLDVEFTGESSHAGSQPELGRNALLAAGSALMNLNSIPRHGKGATRINVGTLVAGGARNAVPSKAFMEIETRGASTDLDKYMYENVIRILEHAAATWKCELKITPMGSAPSGSSDNDFADKVIQYTEKTKILKPSDALRVCGSEDFTCMLEHVRRHGGKGAAITVGSGPNGKHHSAEFDTDEAVIGDTVIFSTGLILEIMGEGL